MQFQLFYMFALFSIFIDNRSLYQAFGFHKEHPIIIGFILFSDALGPMDTVVKLLMNILSRKFEFEAGMSYETFPLKDVRLMKANRCIRRQAWLHHRTSQIADQTANPEPQHHGRRLDVCELSLLPSNFVGTIASFRMGQCEEGKCEQADGSG